MAVAANNAPTAPIKLASLQHHLSSKSLRQNGPGLPILLPSKRHRRRPCQHLGTSSPTAITILTPVPLRRPRKAPDPFSPRAVLLSSPRSDSTHCAQCRRGDTTRRQSGGPRAPNRCSRYPRGVSRSSGCCCRELTVAPADPKP